VNHDDDVDRERSFRCLIVEDNINAAEIMTIFFERNGIVSETAGNGQLGLQMYFDKPSEYDVIFLDLQMPLMNGFEMAKRIRESGVSKSRTIPIVAMSGTYAENMIEGGGFSYFLKKPFTMRCLAEIIEEIKQTTRIG